MSEPNCSAASGRYGLDWKTEDAIERNARSMKPKEYAWLKAQDFQPPIRRALIAEFERLHGGSHA